MAKAQASVVIRKAPKDGASVTVKSTEVAYGVSSSGTVEPESWSAAMPGVTAGQWLWAKTVVTYSDGKKTETKTKAYQGKDGEDAYTVEAYTLTGDKIKNGEGSADLYARVLRGGAVVEDSGTAERQFRYTWRKYDRHGKAANWEGTSSPDKEGNPVRVMADDIDTKATFRCTVTRK